MLNVNELIEATNGKLMHQARTISIKGISIDSRRIKPQDAFICIKGNNFDGHNFIAEAIEKGASCIIAHSLKFIVHSKKKVPIIKVNDTTKALGDIARFQRNKFNIPVVAITGSNGKTTTKEMLAWVLSKRFKVLKNEGTKNNQFGLSLTLLELNSSYDIAVLELGTNHFGEIDYLARICRPNIGIITNIGPAHLENLRNLEGVFREKYGLIKNLENPYIGVLNADDEFLKRKVFEQPKRTAILGFGIKCRTDFFAADIRAYSNRLEFSVNPAPRPNERDVKERFTNAAFYSKHKWKGVTRCGVNKKSALRLKTPGYYNIYNALAAVTVARIFGVGYKDIALSLATFNFPQGRLKFISSSKINFIDDTYNSNPFSLRQALNALDNFKINGRKIFIMGDMLELGGYKESLHEQAGRDAIRHCDILITVGRLSKLAAEAAKKCSSDSRIIFRCKTTQQARDILFNQLSPKKNDLVLVKGSRLMKMEEIFKTS